jgi:putative heme-binding domain-containing protein
VVRTCLTALEHLPGDATPEALLPVLRLLHRLEQEPRERALRQQALAFLAHRAGQTFTVPETSTDAAALRQAYQPVFTWFAGRYPSQAAALSNTDGEDPAFWDRLLRSVDWSKGDVARGEVLFRDRACQTCHSGGRALGPDLTGVSNRFSRADLFTAIIYPSKDVAPAYRTTVIETQSGQIHTGIIAFESADGIILQTGATTTLRIGTPDIAARSPGTRSLMPNALLKDLKPADLADLYRFLQTLQPKPGATQAAR